MRVPAVSASIAFAVYVSTWRVWKVSSATLIVSATDEFLRRLSDSFVIGGTISRSAIGRMIRRYAWPTGQAHGQRGLELRSRNGEDAGADHLGHARARVDAERDDGRPEFSPVVEEPVLHPARQERRDAEVPEEHPHEQRNVPEELHVEDGGERAAA